MTFAKMPLIALTAILSLSFARAEPAKPDAPQANTTQPAPAAPSAAPANDNASKLDVATLLFGNPQWSQAPVGSNLTYAYSKKTTDAKFGPSFDDTIKLKLDKGDKPDNRTVEVHLFSGANAKPAGPFESDSQNPVLLLVFEENVQELSKLYKANPRYLKNAIRKAWRDDAKIESVPVDVNGKQVAGTRISVTPFVNDAEKDKMMGLEGMIYTVEIADSVPGLIANIDIHAPTSGKPGFSETMHYQPEAKP